MPNLWSWLFRSIVALAAAGACASALAATPAQIGVFRDGQWFLDANGNGQWDGTPTDIYYVFGQAGDVPVVGDWNGDGITKIGVYRNGVWYLDYNGNGVWDGEPADKVYVYGLASYNVNGRIESDIPVVGDWNGDGRSKIGVFRRESRGKFDLDYNGNGAWNSGTDVTYLEGSNWWGFYLLPVSGDWNGDGRSKVGVLTPNGQNTNWWLDYDGNGPSLGTDRKYAWGTEGDIPIAGDWNGTGFSKIGVFRNGWWYTDYNGNGAWDLPPDQAFMFGLPGDKPLVATRWK